MYFRFIGQWFNQVRVGSDTELRLQYVLQSMSFVVQVR